jgi:predicted dehydrogenase
MTSKVTVGFIGAGGIARSHACALNSLRFYYNDVPEIVPYAVCSAKKTSRELFAERYGFRSSPDIDEFVRNREIDTVFILGPNKVHYEHLRVVMEMPSIRRIYLEKPVCSSREEEEEILKLVCERPGLKIQTGYQYLFMASVREALRFWSGGILGKPLHFDVRYYHGDYLDKRYRDKRTSRLTPAPDGGAMADLGSHAVSLVIAFLGNNLKIHNAIQAGSFQDVVSSSDLFSLSCLYDTKSLASGTVAASRIASGSGDLLSMELFAVNGSIRFSSQTPDYFEYYLESSGSWHRIPTGSVYTGITSFPSGHVHPGWLRPMIHAHYVFLSRHQDDPVVPDIIHGLEVQRIVRETADHLEIYRKAIKLNTEFPGNNIIP